MTIKEEAEKANQVEQREKLVKAMQYLLRSRKEELARHKQAMALLEIDEKAIDNGYVPSVYDSTVVNRYEERVDSNGKISRRNI